MIYCGEHAVSKDEIIKQINKSVQYANSGYVDVPIGGLLLVYDSYFVHIIEVCSFNFVPAVLTQRFSSSKLLVKDFV